MRCAGVMRTAVTIVAMAAAATPLPAAEPPAINPFGPRPAPTQREDAVPGYVELSNGEIHPGDVYLTRDVRLKIYDQKMQRQREVPLRVVKRIECGVVREWMEKEWKFKELASSEKMYTGREYPAREYLHRITLNDGRQIIGPLAGIVYVQPYRYTPSGPAAYRDAPQPKKFVLYKRQKGEIGEDLKSLVYVKQIELGKEAYEEGYRKASERRKEKAGEPGGSAGRG